MRDEYQILVDINRSGDLGYRMTKTRRGIARQTRGGGCCFQSNIHGLPQHLRQEITEYDRVRKAIREIDALITAEENKIQKSHSDDHQRRRELMQDRHKQIMQLLDKMDQTKLAQGASAVQIEQERTRRAEISRQIQSLINQNDAQDQANLDGLLDELRTMATHGLP